ncbi:alpha/beta fold hydrolase [Mycobacterium sp. HNNTM2301]|uniref:alpha/beta fold hydrolase n=1 Tax=Mycobacterium hainanense TaxID=3289775 RepID=UPI0035A587D8
MLTSSPGERFRLAYERQGTGGRPVILLLAWPGDHTDYRHVVPLVGKGFHVVVPDCGFGTQFKAGAASLLHNEDVVPALAGAGIPDH